MNAEQSVASLLPALGDLMRWMRDRAFPYVIVGGVGVAFRGRPRVTRDVGAVVLIPSDEWQAFVEE